MQKIYPAITSCSICYLVRLWVAIIAYLIIAKIKADYKGPYSITEVATLIRISALDALHFIQ